MESGGGGLGLEKEQGGGGESAGVVDLSELDSRVYVPCAHVTMFTEITGVPLNGSLVELQFHGHYSQYRWEFLNSARKVCLLTLTIDSHHHRWLVNPRRLHLQVSSLNTLLTLTRGPDTIF